MEHLDKCYIGLLMHRETDRASRQIELMQEYRTRLIADVVTG